MTYLAILANIILGALWRRHWGGWERDHKRWGVVLEGIPLTWPFWLVLPWWGAAIASALAITFFAPSQRTDTNAVFLRYGPFGLGYWLAYRYWPETWTLGDFEDGWMSVGALFLGGTFWGTVAAVCVAVM